LGLSNLIWTLAFDTGVFSGTQFSIPDEGGLDDLHMVWTSEPDLVVLWQEAHPDRVQSSSPRRSHLLFDDEYGNPTVPQ
jgi:hypothetical protein